MSKANSPNTKTPSRRALLAGAPAVAAVALAAGDCVDGFAAGLAALDPIYELIKRHRETIRAWDAASTEVDRLQKDWYARRKSPFEEPPDTALADAEELQDATGDIEISAADALVE